MKKAEMLRAHKCAFPEPGIRQLTERVYVISASGGNNAVLVVGQTGNLLVDALNSEAEGKFAANLVNSVSPNPVKTLIYTHMHPDHTGGAGAIAPLVETVISRKPSTAVYPGNELLRDIGNKRGARQFGMGLTAEENLNMGLGPYNPGFSQTAPLAPTVLLTERETVLVIEGVQVTLLAAEGETDDHLFVWLPEDGVLCPGDNFYASFPSTSPLRGGQFRNVGAWVESLDKALSLHPIHLVPGHTNPVSGRETVKKTLSDYRDGLKYVFEETLKGMNQGLNPDQLVNSIKLPPHLRDVPALKDFYGKISWTVRGLYTGYLGWFDGNPTHLESLPPKTRAQKQIKLAGGTERVLKAAATAVEQADSQWAADLCDVLLDAGTDMEEAKQLKVAALRQMGLDTENACARHYYLCSAKELEQTPV